MKIKINKIKTSPVIIQGRDLMFKFSHIWPNVITGQYSIFSKLWHIKHIEIINNKLSIEFREGIRSIIL